MKQLRIGVIGYGVVGQGVVKILKKKAKSFRETYGCDFKLAALCDRSVHKKDTKGLGSTLITDNMADVLNDPEIDVVIELIGGKTVAKQIVRQAIDSGKHVITANKDLIANDGLSLFKLAEKKGVFLLFESAVGAGIPVIKTLTEGVAGNHFKSLYAIINGTCNFILSEMADNNLSFDEALKKAQHKGYAESDPTLDVNGMDSTHKLAIMAYLAFGRLAKVKKIYTEGITHVEFRDIEYAKEIGLVIKLLAIAKRQKDGLEIRVHPTLIDRKHPLASINQVYNAVLFNTDHMGQMLLSGEGAGQFAAASGVISDLVNLATKSEENLFLANRYNENVELEFKNIDTVETKFYLRLNVANKAGVLSDVSGILAKNNISILSVDQSASHGSPRVPLILITDETQEKAMQVALEQIKKLKTVFGKPVAIRMENL